MKRYFVSVFTIMVFGSLFALGNKEVEPIQNSDYNYEVSIDNMTCSLCNVAVEKQLIKLDWIRAVNGDHTTGLALLRIDNPLDIADMEKIIDQELDKIDYNFVKLRRLPNG